MKSNATIQEDLLSELEEVRRQLQEANDTIEAIRTGQVDALVVHNGTDHQLYTLKTADRAYRVFIEKMTEGAVTLNRDGIILYANSQFGALVGLPLTAVMGLPFARFVAPADLPFYQTIFSSCWKEDCKGEIGIHHQGRTTAVQLSLTALELEEGVSLSIIITDLTLQKAAQEQLAENNRKLESLNRSLEASNHDLQQFASVASHDLQEPLRKIQLFANLMKGKAAGKFTTEEARYLDKMIGSATRMKTLIVDVLNYSRLSAGDKTFYEVDLNGVVKELLEDFELLIEEKGAAVRCGPLPTLEANRGQMRQVFQNLLSNALKFSKAGEPPVVAITARQVAEKNFAAAEQPGGPFCLLSVKDNGIGFEEKYVPNIFSLFERLHSKEDYEGSGIGLAIAKKIVEKHDGLIQVKSELGRGAEFRIIIPIKHTNN